MTLGRSRVSAAPHASSSQPGAQKPGAPPTARSSMFSRLREREHSSAAGRLFARHALRERFSDFRLRLRLDMYRDTEFVHLHGRSRVVELTAASGMLFALGESGVCTAFDMGAGSRIAILNENSGEVVRSLFHNKVNGTLITVSVHEADHYASLHCCARTLPHLRAGVVDRGVVLFSSESLRWPGFVEFYDVNGKVLTFSADRSTYKVWSMAEPSKLLYQFSNDLYPEGIQEVKISPGIMLLVCEQTTRHVFLRVLSMETGESLQAFAQPLIEPLHQAKLELIEQFNEKLLIQQEGHELRIIDLLTSEVVRVKDASFRTSQTAFIFLHETLTFLAFKDHTVTHWNFRGERIRTFDDHRLWFPHPDMDRTSVIFITQAQDVVISLCEDAREGGAAAAEGSDSGAEPRVSVHVSSIAAGRCLARIPWKVLTAEPANITSLCYCEDVGDIITGTEDGRIQVWST